LGKEDGKFRNVLIWLRIGTCLQVLVNTVMDLLVP
jgi:hypothetical protein